MKGEVKVKVSARNAKSTKNAIVSEQRKENRKERKERGRAEKERKEKTERRGRSRGTAESSSEGRKERCTEVVVVVVVVELVAVLVLDRVLWLSEHAQQQVQQRRPITSYIIHHLSCAGTLTSYSCIHHTVAVYITQLLERTHEIGFRVVWGVAVWEWGWVEI